MGHNLYQGRLVTKVPAWHHLGTVSKEKMTLLQAIGIARCDFNITSEPVYVVVDGQYVECSDRKAIVRHPSYDDTTYQVLDIVSSSYSLVTNLEFASFYEELSTLYPVETMGALGKGETFFFTLDAGEVEINNELVHQFFVGNDNKTGLEKTRLVYTPIPAVCQNTLTLGLKKAVLDIAVPHRVGNKEKLQEIAKISTDMKKSIDEVNQLFIGMGKSFIQLSEFKKLVEEVLYPTEEDASPTGVDELFGFEFKKSKMQERQASILSIYEQYNDTNPQYGNSLWNAFQAITDDVDHKPGRGTGQYVSMLFGSRANEKALAFAELQKLVK